MYLNRILRVIVINVNCGITEYLEITRYRVLQQVIRFLIIFLIVSTVKAIRSFREKHDFACLYENSFPSIISEIPF